MITMHPTMTMVDYTTTMLTPPTMLMLTPRRIGGMAIAVPVPMPMPVPVPTATASARLRPAKLRRGGRVVGRGARVGGCVVERSRVV